MVVMAVVVFAALISAAIPPLAGALAPFVGIAWPWYVLIGTAVTVLNRIAISCQSLQFVTYQMSISTRCV